MKVLYHIFVVLSILLAFNSASSTPDTLELLGQVSGGACFTVEYKDGRLYAGGGTAIIVYDAADPAEEIILARRDFLSIVSDIIVRDDTIIFVGANHDGIYAIDGTDPSLPILAYLPMPDHSHWVGDLELIPPDTLWLCDLRGLRKLYFNGSAFIELESYFDGRKVSGVGIRDTLMAVCTREFLSGHVELYNTANGGMELVDIYNASVLSYVVDAQFADLRDDIIYVLGGSPNLGLNGDFIALQVDGDSLFEIARRNFHGVPGFAQTFIMNMDSRNDTLFLATMAGMYWPAAPDTPWTDCPVLDCTLLPDTFTIIGHIIPGLWFFDVALHDELPALAIASEWFGVLWTDISDLSVRDDTIATHATGGWGQHAYLYGDTLWLAWEGYGVGIFDVSDPSFPIQIGRIPGSFASDLVIVDTILYLSRSSQFIFYNLAPWRRGFDIEPIDTFAPPIVLFEIHICHGIAAIETDVGTRILCGTSEVGVNLIDPLDLPFAESVGLLFEDKNPLQMRCFGDTLFMVGSESLFIAIITHDSAIVLAKAGFPDAATGLCREDNFVAVMCELSGVYWFHFTGDSLVPHGNWNPVAEGRDVEYRDSLLYASCSSEGIYILDLWHSPDPETLAWFPGTGGWEFLHFGSSHITLADDGKIFLTDYHGACFILESYDDFVSISGYNNTNLPDKLQISCYPNPFNGALSIEISGLGTVGTDYNQSQQMEIYDINGRMVYTDRRECLSIQGKNTRQYESGWEGDLCFLSPLSCSLSFSWKPEESIPSGIYLVKIKIWNNVMSRKVVYLK